MGNSMYHYWKSQPEVLRQILVEGKAESLFRKRQKQGMRLFFFLLRKLRLRGKMFRRCCDFD